MEQFLAEHWLDIFTTLLGLLYIWLEYRANIWLWAVGIVMPALDIYLYYSHGLYGDAAMAIYYTVAAIYGLLAWLFGISLARLLKRGTTAQKELQISRMPINKYIPTLVFLAVAWGVTYWILITYTNSTVPLLDSFTNAMSFVGLWALAKKYIEQWLFWIIVDAVCCYLYIIKGIPFKALLYGLYVFIAVMGWIKWEKMRKAQ